MQRTTMLNRFLPYAQPARPPSETEPALKVATIYQDPLTRHWATELWERVGQLIGTEDVRRQSWKISELTDPRVFLDAVQAAAEADVLVVSVRDTGELPISLYVWVDAWVPSRSGPAGALVALIGMPPHARSFRSRLPILGDRRPQSPPGFPATGAQTAGGIRSRRPARRRLAKRQPHITLGRRSIPHWPASPSAGTRR